MPQGSNVRSGYWPQIGFALVVLAVCGGVVTKGLRIRSSLEPTEIEETSRAVRSMGDGTARTTRAALTAVSGLGDSWRRRTHVQLELERAVAAGLARDPACAVELGASVDTLPAELLPAVARGIGRTLRPAGVSLLERLLGRSVELDQVVLAELAGVDLRDRQALRGHLAARLRPYLAHADPRLRKQAALSLGRLHDFASVPRLIALLADQGAPAQAALHALQLVADDAERVEAGRWQEWHRTESAWLETVLPLLEPEVRAMNPRRPAAALRELERHAHLRDEIAPLVVAALGHADPAVAQRACALAARGRCDAALAALLRLLEHGGESVRPGAHAALCSISGLDGPPEAAWWRAWLHG
jgi:hypothetical protein